MPFCIVRRCSVISLKLKKIWIVPNTNLYQVDPNLHNLQCHNKIETLIEILIY